MITDYKGHCRTSSVQKLVSNVKACTVILPNYLNKSRSGSAHVDGVTLTQQDMLQQECSHIVTYVCTHHWWV